jgi:hypothetical protein
MLLVGGVLAFFLSFEPWKIFQGHSVRHTPQRVNRPHQRGVQAPSAVSGWFRDNMRTLGAWTKVNILLLLGIVLVGASVWIAVDALLYYGTEAFIRFALAAAVLSIGVGCMLAQFGKLSSTLHGMFGSAKKVAVAIIMGAIAAMAYSILNANENSVVFYEDAWAFIALGWGIVALIALLYVIGKLEMAVEMLFGALSGKYSAGLALILWGALLFMIGMMLWHFQQGSDLLAVVGGASVSYWTIAMGWFALIIGGTATLLAVGSKFKK